MIYLSEKETSFSGTLCMYSTIGRSGDASEIFLFVDSGSFMIYVVRLRQMRRYSQIHKSAPTRPETNYSVKWRCGVETHQPHLLFIICTTRRSDNWNENIQFR